MAVCSIFGIAVNQLYFFSGLSLTSPINASLIMTTTPLLVLLASAVLLGEKITPLKIIGILIGALGAGVLITSGKSIELGEQAWLGNLLVFINASSYGVYLVLVKPLMIKYHPFTVIRWVFLFGIIWLTPFGASEIMQTEWSSFNVNVWLAVGYVLIFTTFFAYLFNAFALSKVNPSVVSIYIYLQPLLTSLIAILAVKDQLSPVKILAGILIFIGVYMVSRPIQKSPVKIRS